MAGKKVAVSEGSASREVASGKPLRPAAPAPSTGVAQSATGGSEGDLHEAGAHDLLPEIPKTYLTDEQLEGFRRLLLEKRHELVADVEDLANEALRRSRSEACGDLSSMPIHMADIGTDNWEQEFTMGLIDNEQALLREIDEALQRIENHTYGVCLGTHKRISVARLRAKPWAKYCIEYARLFEQGRAPRA